MRAFAICMIFSLTTLYGVNTYDLQVAMQPRGEDAPTKKVPKLDPAQLRGELMAVLATGYSEPNIVVEVDASGLVTLFNMPTSARLKESIVTYIKNYPKVTAVQIVDTKGYQPVDPIKWLSFPRTLLFYPLIANPLEIETGWAIFAENSRLAVNSANPLQTIFSIGTYIPLVRWFNRHNQKRSMQLDFDVKNLCILNLSGNSGIREASYQLGLNYSIGTEVLSYRFSFWHLHSYFGNGINIQESTPSVDIYPLELVISAQSTKDFRLYFGGGAGTYKQNATFFIYGAEFFFYEFKPHGSREFYQTFFALDFQNWERFNYDPSLTAKLGISWSRLPSASKQGKFTVTYHNGLGFGPYLFNRQKYITAGFEYGF